MQQKMHFSYVNPTGLLKNSWNPNEMSPEAEAKLRNSLEKHGHVRPILVRELDDGQLEIVGGAHRVDLSIELGHESVPVINLGQISDEDAKRALLLDNSRYGEDDAARLSALLADIGTADELVDWVNMDLSDLESLIGSSDSGTDELALLDDLDDLGSDDSDLPETTREIQTHQTMKFKVDLEDAEFVKEVIESIISSQRIDDSDSSVRSGEALLWLCRDYKGQTPDPTSDVAATEEDELDLAFDME